MDGRKGGMPGAQDKRNRSMWIGAPGAAAQDA
jgi:hypothetical protein